MSAGRESGHEPEDLATLRHLAFGGPDAKTACAALLPTLRYYGIWGDTQVSELAILATDPCSDTYHFAVQELMCVAAFKKDRPLFEEMLTRAEDFQRRTGLPFGIINQALCYWPNQVNQYVLMSAVLYNGYVIVSNGRFWIPPQHPWFPEVVERLGGGLGCAPTSRCFLMRSKDEPDGLVSLGLPSPISHTDKKLLFTNLPAHYVALAGGYIEQVKWFYEQGAYSQGWLEKRPGEIPKIRAYMYDKEQAIPRVCSNVLTAALYSNDFQVVRYVFERFPHVRCRREMLYPLYHCDRRLISRVLYLRPDLWEVITRKDILRSKSAPLLKAWLHQHPEGLPAGYRFTCRPTHIAEPPEYRAKESEFFYLLIRHTEDPNTRLELLRQWLGWLGAQLKWGLQLFGEKELEWFGQLVPRGEDLMPLITGQENERKIFRGLFWCWGVLRGGSEEQFPYSIDIYSVTPHMIRKMPLVDLTRMHPVRILPRPDPVTAMLSRFLTLAEMEKLGFVTSVNLPYIRLSKKRPQYHDVRSLALLQQRARDRSLIERYSFETTNEEE